MISSEVVSIIQCVAAKVHRAVAWGIGVCAALGTTCMRTDMPGRLIIMAKQFVFQYWGDTPAAHIRCWLMKTRAMAMYLPKLEKALLGHYIFSGVSLCRLAEVARVTLSGVKGANCFGKESVLSRTRYQPFRVECHIPLNAYSYTVD